MIVVAVAALDVAKTRGEVEAAHGVLVARGDAKQQCAARGAAPVRWVPLAATVGIAARRRRVLEFAPHAALVAATKVAALLIVVAQVADLGQHEVGILRCAVLRARLSALVAAQGPHTLVVCVAAGGVGILQLAPLSAANRVGSRQRVEVVPATRVGAALIGTQLIATNHALAVVPLTFERGQAFSL